MTILENAWARCFEDLSGSQPPSCVWDELLAHYSEPQRAYHTVQHLNECFAWFKKVRQFAKRPGEVALALFYHDAIYDPQASDNEKKSAELAATVIEEYVRGDADAKRIESLIMATVHSAVPQDADTQLLIDIDLSILGAEDARFGEYEKQVRIEYDWVKPDDFREGRIRILKQFLERSAIYNHSFAKSLKSGRASILPVPSQTSRLKTNAPFRCGNGGVFVCGSPRSAYTSASKIFRARTFP